MNTDWVRQVASIALRAPSADNSQPWALRWTGSSLQIEYAQRAKANDVFAAASHATLISVGAVMDHLRAALQTNESAADFQWPDQPALGKPYVALPLTGNPGKFIEPAGLLTRHTNRGPFRRTALAGDVMDSFVRREYGGARVVLVTNHKEKSGLVRLARLSSEARFCNQRLHEWLIASLRFTPQAVASGDGLDVNALCLPPGGTQFLRFIADWRRLNALNRIGAYKLLAFSEVALLAAAPALLCIVGGGETRSVLDAGQLLSRVWTELNAKGIAVHPYYVVADQVNRLRDGTLAPGFDAQIQSVEKELRHLLALGTGEQLHMMLRIGEPKLTPVRSRRLPLDAVLIDETRAI